ncbi:MAG: tetratricopeptide repeat protein [Acidobacteria bacterium]|nr:tetratricopeptide repeat protein [Acidobacteriota bacterium]
MPTTIPPSGTVTLLFTDVEGSTRLWEGQPAAMRIALEQHDSLINEVIENHTGYVFYTGGDAFGAAFAAPSDALAAAITIQQDLQRANWPDETGALRVRMALHTGEPDERDGDYLGPPVNRVARLLAAGHGGQILLSLATQELVRDGLQDGTGLIELGKHRLKDLFRPETIFQVTAPDLESEFPELVTLDSQHTNLPSQATPFIGRRRELAALTELLSNDDVRLVTLTGPGGIGKTRLSLQVAADLLDEFEDGAFFVELAPITGSDQMITAIAGTLGMTEAGDEYPVPPLSLPEESRSQTAAVISQYEAVSLFIQRAKATQPDFEIVEHNAAAIAEICTRLEGLPLAIELAAARVRLFEPEMLLARLSDSLKTLTGGARNLPRRHQTIRNTIEWSYDLLDDDEQALFARLGVFRGGRSVEAIEAVCGPDLAIDVWDGLESLLNKSLLRREEGPEGEPRFVMLETIHAYASERLADSTEADELRKRHAEYFAAMAELASTKLTGHEQGMWLNRLTLDYENMRKAMDWTLGGGDVQTGLRLVGALGGYWRYKSHLQEGQRWLQLALDLGDQAPDSVLGQLLAWAGFIAFGLNDSAESKRLYETALVIERKLNNPSAVARILISLGLTSSELSETSIENTKEGLALAREIGDKSEIAHGLNVLGEIHRMQGDYAAAGRVYEEALPITREIGHRLRETMLLGNLGIVAFNLGDFEQAKALFLESYKLALEIGDDFIIAEGLSFGGGVLGALGEPERGVRLLGAGATQQAAIGSSTQPSDQHEYDKLIALVRNQLDDETFDRLWAEGEALSLEEAIELRLRDDEPVPRRGQ